MIKNIYLDLDGVICDWKGKVCELLNIDQNDSEARNILRKDAMLCGYKFQTTAYIDSIVEEKGYEFWRNLELLPWAEDLWKMVNSLDRKVYILSNPGHFHDAAHAKLDYIWDKLGTRNYILTKHKYLLANSESILIDDMKHNIKKFSLNGGKTYYWPNQYELIDGNESINLHLRILQDNILNG